MINSLANSLFNGILDFVIKIIQIVLIPIDSLISSSLPGFDNFLSNVTQFFTYCLGAIGWVIDSLFVPRDVISMVCVYLVFKLTISLSTYTIKFALKWYRALK